MYARTHIYMYTGEEAGVTARFTHIPTSIYVHMYTYAHICEEVGVTARFTNIPISIYAHIYTYAHICTHVRTYTCTQVRRLVSQLDFQTVEAMQDFTLGEVSKNLKIENEN